MSETRWLVELLLPSGTFMIRPAISDRTNEEFDAEIEHSVESLMSRETAAATAMLSVDAWSPTEEEPSPPPLQPQCRLLMAHFACSERAKEIASDLRAIFPHTPLPWSRGTREAFESYLKSKKDVPTAAHAVSVDRNWNGVEQGTAYHHASGVM